MGIMETRLVYFLGHLLFVYLLILAFVNLSPPFLALSFDLSWAPGFNFSVVVPGLLWICPTVIIVLFARNKFHAALSTCLFLVFYAIIAGILLIDIGPNVWGSLAYDTLSVLMWILPLILLSVAPAKAVSGIGWLASAEFGPAPAPRPPFTTGFNSCSAA